MSCSFFINKYLMISAIENNSRNEKPFHRLRLIWLHWISYKKVIRSTDCRTSWQVNRLPSFCHNHTCFNGLNWNEENSEEENNSWCMPWCMIMHDGHVICVHNPKPNNTYACTCCACCVRCTCYTIHCALLKQRIQVQFGSAQTAFTLVIISNDSHGKFFSSWIKNNKTFWFC